MKTSNLRFMVVASVLILAGCATAPRSSRRAADPADVRTIRDIVRASYETICGPAGAPRDWARDRTLYSPGAVFVAIWQKEDGIEKKLLTPEQYRRDFKVGNGIYETEIGQRIERFGDVAQVRSVSAFRETPDGPILKRYVNYFHLYWDDTRWWIAGVVWDTERPGAPIPEKWVGVWEEVPPRSSFAAPTP